MEKTDQMTIGEIARRAGLATSTLRYYEDEGLIESSRTSGNQRRFRRSELRRIALIRAAQSFGLTLSEIRAALASLPEGRVPNRRDWERLAGSWREIVDDRIESLQRFRDQATACIGCGCLSIENCGLYNIDDAAARRGDGARFLLGDRPPKLGSGR